LATAVAARALGKYERLCWEREERDHDDPRHYHYDPLAAEHPITFIETLCRHHKGEWAGRPLLLEEWQKRIIRSVFGWKRPDGTRRYRIAYIEVPRKNGKSELAAALGLYLLVADHEAGAEVYSSATKKDQAKIVHDTATAMVRASPELKRFVKVFRNNLHVPRLGSKFEPLGADSNTMDGLNPHGNIVDELHAHKDRGVWDVLDTAMGARRQPLTLAITTAGVYESESIGWQQHDHAVKVLERVVEDDAFYAFIAAADEGDAWDCEETWQKANPNYGVSVKPEYLAQQAQKAAAQPSFLNTFLRLHLDRWTQQLNRWITIEDWNQCEREMGREATEQREADLLGRECFGALDLSTKLDISALVLWFPESSTLVPRFWIPEANIEKRVKRDRVPYDAWVRDGWMTATPGNVIDYEWIKAEVVALSHKYQIRELAFDPWNATQIATQLGDAGLVLVEMRQGFQSLSEPSKEFEKLIVAHSLNHGGNPVLRWMASNVAVKRDPADNIKPDKAASSDRIDGIVASIMALGRAIVAPAEVNTGWMVDMWGAE
jgi:phage terminase large subunit-like protein